MRQISQLNRIIKSGDEAIAGLVVTPPRPLAEKRRAAAQLELFARRCLDLADRVAENRMAFLDAVDMAYSAAEWCGLVDDLGDDLIQATMAAAFANAKRPA
jgi:hypothetical protein